MKRIPISRAKSIAKDYGYDQIIIIGRKIGAAPDPHGEHITTYGVNIEHCNAAALQGRQLAKLFGWPEADQQYICKCVPDIGEPGDDDYLDGTCTECRTRRRKR